MSKEKYILLKQRKSYAKITSVKNLQLQISNEITTPIGSDNQIDFELPKTERANITVQIFEATNLPRLDSDGYSDPFVKLTICPNKPDTKSKDKLTEHNIKRDRNNLNERFTDVIKGKLHPNWNELFEFDNVDLSVNGYKYLDLEIWDADLLQKSEFSSFIKSGIKLDKNDIEDEWFDLQTSKHATDKLIKYTDEKLKNKVKLKFKSVIKFRKKKDEETQLSVNLNSKNKKSRIRVAVHYHFLSDEKQEVQTNDEPKRQSIFNIRNPFKKKFDQTEEISHLENNVKAEPMTLIVDLFQGRNLPNMDSTGLSDAFVKVRFCGKETQSEIIDNNIAPAWYEKLTITATVPHCDNLNNAPRIYCEVLDYDVLSKNRTMGRFSICPGEIDTEMKENGHDGNKYKVNYALKKAHWYSLENTQQKHVEGELHMSFQLLKGIISSRKKNILKGINSKGNEIKEFINNDNKRQIIPKNIDQGNKTKYNLQIISYGLRDIKSIFGVNKTYLKFEINGISCETNKSNIPDSKNPNFNEILNLPVMLPENSEFWPALNVKVIDSQCGGAIKRTIGFASINISNPKQLQDERKYDVLDIKDDVLDIKDEYNENKEVVNRHVVPDNENRRE
eukprot:201107_1